MSTSHESISLLAISLRTSGVTSSTFRSQTSGVAILAFPGTANERGSLLSGEKRRTFSAILTHSGTDRSPLRTVEAFP